MWREMEKHNLSNLLNAPSPKSRKKTINWNENTENSKTVSSEFSPPRTKGVASSSWGGHDSCSHYVCRYERERKAAQEVGTVQTVTVLKNGTDAENWRRMSLGRDFNFLVTYWSKHQEKRIYNHTRGNRIKSDGQSVCKQRFMPEHPAASHRWNYRIRVWRKKRNLIRLDIW